MNSGFSKENIIIFDENKVDDFKNLDIDVIYTCGGNTFTLLKLIKDCGFDKEIKKYVENGVIYIGRSAGSHLVSKNIEHVLPFDDNYIGLSNFDGIGLFDGIIYCHYTDERKPYYEASIKENKYNTFKITNDEVILINDNTTISM